jgi:hypothetical protein
MPANVDFSVQMLLRATPASFSNDNVLVTLIVYRTGSLATPLQPRLELFVSADQLLDESDPKLLDRLLNFNTNVSSIGFNVVLNLRPSAMARGAFNFITIIDENNVISETNELNNVRLLNAGAIGADVVLEWITTCLTAVMCEGQQGRGIGPTVGSRTLAMLSTAIYDTVCGFNTTQIPYLVSQEAESGASLQAAVIGAANRVLTQLIPEQADFFAFQAQASLAELGSMTNSAVSSGVAFGELVANQILQARAADGSTDNTPYMPPSTTGYVWQPQPEGPTAGAALGPNWGSVTPFAISNAASYLPTGGINGLEAHPDYNYAKYVEQLEEVRLFGGLANTATTTVQRTADQTQMALFWAYDREDTYRPYGQLNQIAIDLSLKTPGMTVERNAALFAALNVALADAVIVAWKAKYLVRQPRPSDLITGQTVDANNVPLAPVVDTLWQSLLSEINGVQSPPFPDYLSGHSAMGGVFASVMTEYFGNNRTFDAFSMELPWQPSSTGIKRTFTGFTDANGVVRNSFYQAGLEDALSRIYGGVHIREACEDSFAMGLQVGDVVANTFFQNVGG